jgi:hypothetical protein
MSRVGNSPQDDDRVLLCGPLAARLLSELAQSSQDDQAPQSAASPVRPLPPSHGNVLCFLPLHSAIISAHLLFCSLLWNLCKSSQDACTQGKYIRNMEHEGIVFFTTHVDPGKQNNNTLGVESPSFLTYGCQEVEMSSQVSTKSIYEAMAREIEMEGEVQEGKVEEASHSLSRFCSILWDWGCPSEMAKAIDRSGLSQAGIGLGRPMLIHST